MDKTYTRSASVARNFYFPPELIWGEIIGHKTQEIDPLDEDTFENELPRQGEIFTRLVERVDNELISMDMKSQVNNTRFTVKLEQLGECLTRVTVTQNVTYFSFKWLALNRFGANIRAEGSYYLDDLSKKLKALSDKYKKDKHKGRN